MSGSLIGGVVGATIGFFIPGVGPALGWGIGSAIGSSWDVIPGPKLGEARAQSYRDGTPITLGWGTFCTAGTVVEPGPVRTVNLDDEAGKGGPAVGQGDRFFQTFGILFAEATDEAGYGGVTRIWENEKLVYDVTLTSAIPQETARYADGITIYLGTTDQLPDPDLEAIHGIGNVPAYRGRLLIVWKDKDITDYGGATPQIRIEVASAAGTTISNDWVALDSSTPAGNYLPSPDGFDWDNGLATYPAPGTPSHSIASGNGVLVISGSGGPGPGVGPWVLHSLDGGITWQQSSGASHGTGFTFMHYLPLHQLFFKVGTSSDSIQYSGDGVVWVTSAYPAGTYRPVAESSTTIVIGRHNNSIVRSFNGGLTFTQVGGVTSGIAGVAITALAFGDGKFVAAGNRSNSLGVSTNGGITWNHISNPFAGGTGSNNHFVLLYGLGIWVMSGGDGAKWSADLATWEWIADINVELLSGIFHAGRFIVGGRDGKIYTSTDGINFTDQPNSFGTAGFVRGFGIASSRSIDGAQGDPVPLSTIVDGISDRTTIPQTQRITSALDEIMVRGLALNGTYSAGEACGTLMQLYRFDAPEFDDAIRFKLRGGVVDWSIPLDDFIDDGNPVELMREESRSFPKQLHIHYQPQETDWNATKQTSQRRSNDYRVVGEVSIQSPVNHDADEAAQIAAILHNVAWTEAEGTLAFKLPIKYVGVTPSDIISVPVANKLTRIRADRVAYDDGDIIIDGRRDRRSDYTSEVTGVAPPPVTPPAPSIVGPTAFAWLNLPALGFLDDELGYRVAMGPILPAWSGAAMQRSIDDGESWEFMVSTVRRGTIGTLVEPLGYSPAELIDTTRILRVQLNAGATLESVTDAQLQQRMNAAAIRSTEDADPEIIQFRDAVDEGNGVWSLTYMPRGQLNTRPRAWPDGATFVLLTGVTHFVRESIAAMHAQDIVLRPTSHGDIPEDSTEYPEYFFPPKSLQEWAPHTLVAERDGGNLTLSVTPRFRFGTATMPLRGARISGYRWKVWNGGGPDPGSGYDVEMNSSLASPSITITDPGTVGVSVRAFSYWSFNFVPTPSGYMPIGYMPIHEALIEESV